MRNTDEGDVEVWAEGGKEALAEFREWLGEGPPGAWIEAVRAQERGPTGAYTSFQIEY